jgi:hypothetical protein
MSLFIEAPLSEPRSFRLVFSERMFVFHLHQSNCSSAKRCAPVGICYADIVTFGKKAGTREELRGPRDISKYLTISRTKD